MNTVSVVIPAYNSAALLPRCLDSVLAQTLAAAEVLVVDDGSSDNTAEAVSRYGEAVRLLRQPNGGPGVARNSGISAANGDWIAFLDADDQWVPNKLERQIECAHSHPDAGLIYCDAIVLDADGTATGEFLADKGPASGWVFDRLLHSFFVLPSTALVRRRLLVEAGMFSAHLRRVEDYDLWLRLARVCPFQLVPEALTFYQRQENSSSKDLAAMAKVEIELFRSLLQQDLSSAQRRAARQRLARNLFDYSYETRHTDRSAAWRAAWQAVHTYPRRAAAWKLLLSRLASMAARPQA